MCRECGEIQRVDRDQRCDLCHELWVREGLRAAVRNIIPLGNRWDEDVEVSVVNPAKEKGN